MNYTFSTIFVFFGFFLGMFVMPLIAGLNQNADFSHIESLILDMVVGFLFGFFIDLIAYRKEKARVQNTVPLQSSPSSKMPIIIFLIIALFVACFFINGLDFIALVAWPIFALAIIILSLIHIFRK